MYPCLTVEVSAGPEYLSFCPAPQEFDTNAAWRDGASRKPGDTRTTQRSGFDHVPVCIGQPEPDCQSDTGLPVGGDVWPWVAPGHVTLFVLLMDRLNPGPVPVRSGAGHLAAAAGLNHAIGVLHFPILALGPWAIAQAPCLAALQKIATALALGLFVGQVSVSNAHELIHAPHVHSAAMMLNAPRHSDHHLHPSRRFPELDLDPQRMPVWPNSMPVMATLALFLTQWRRVMDPRARAWRKADEHGNVGHDLTL